MNIGGVVLRSPVVLAPLAGFTDAGFRALAVEHGAGLTYTEMVSAKGLCYGGKGAEPLLRVTDGETPVAVQLFGSEPEFIYRAARDERLARFDIVDINMGCPVRKIVSNGEGSALMENPLLIEEVVRAASEGARRPVTVKIRAGVRQGENVAAECAEAAVKGGACAVAVHPRYREQMYGGSADHTITAEVKSAVNVPVIASGDITDAASFFRIRRESRADGFMIGRGALGRPWLFRLLNWAAGLDDDEIYDESGGVRRETARAAEEKSRSLLRAFDAEKAALKHAEILGGILPERAVANCMKLHICHYAKNTGNAKEVRKILSGVVGTEDLKSIASRYLRESDNSTEA